MSDVRKTREEAKRASLPVVKSKEHIDVIRGGKQGVSALPKDTWLVVGFGPPMAGQQQALSWNVSSSVWLRTFWTFPSLICRRASEPFLIKLAANTKHNRGPADFADCKSWQKTQDAFIDGNLLILNGTRTETMASCQEMCENIQPCKSFDIQNSNCVLHNVTEFEVGLSKAVWSESYLKVDCTMESVSSMQRRVIIHPYTSLETNVKKEACMDKCCASNNCMSFDYIDNKCRLNKEPTGISDSGIYAHFSCVQIRSTTDGDSVTPTTTEASTASEDSVSRTALSEGHTSIGFTPNPNSEAEVLTSSTAEVDSSQTITLTCNTRTDWTRCTLWPSDHTREIPFRLCNISLIGCSEVLSGAYNDALVNLTYSIDTDNCVSPQVPIWSSWQLWSDCSSSCGIGTQTRVRTCNHIGCEGEDREASICNLGRCSTGPADFADCKSWQKTQDAFIDGNLLILNGTRTETMASCQEMCENIQPCKSFDIQNSNCVLHNVTEFEVGLSKAVWSESYLKVDCTMESVSSMQRRVIIHPYTSLETNVKKEACMDKCCASNNCMSFDYIDNKCRLNKEPTGISDSGIYAHFSCVQIRSTTDGDSVTPTTTEASTASEDSVSRTALSEGMYTYGL
ncbi:hypothetical protein CAPTEDRAFT_210475 [Capitella teleta]|uniref:Apple domain-containing protein n=1 Tax=Capitella teleta TaxID=283909 RepID=R7VF14_CAPTE|nr:hypothetical protein CAPTEDRAFT_210475 [Capitella teleta]|eukprot:ELU17189.1 hypothetical protein CAPTEDRAFT_210475 [Capitella teleta]